jgi:two-component system, sensor histidine kinase and response regulator
MLELMEFQILNKNFEINSLMLQGEKARLRHIDDLIRVVLEQKATISDYKISEQLLKELITKYVKAETELKKINELKNKFLGMAAHDLRNPLGAIMNYSQFLKEDEDLDADTQSEFIENIYSASNNMLAVLNDLLDISQIESGKINLRIKLDNLNQLICRRVKLGQVISQNKGIKITTHLDELQEVPFDADRLGQVLDNFISNAIKFSSSGTVIQVRSSIDKGKVKVEVCDQGPGIPEEEICKLFGEFQKLSAQPTGGEKSTGLGLAIVKKMIEAHNGEIGVESTLGQGSTFFFKIPVK